jgi:putative two-component system response regulator
MTGQIAGQTRETPAAPGTTIDALFVRARILVVDDLETNVQLLEQVLHRAGFEYVVGTSDAREVFALFDALQPDILLLDLHMPHLSGHAILETLRDRIPSGSYFPILVLTADITPEAKRRALAGGASDFLGKPYDHFEVILRIQNLLRIRQLHGELQLRNESLEETVRERTRELATAQIEVLERLAQAVEHHDDVTGQHTRRVGEGSARVAAELALPESEVELLRRAAPLHDLGKVGVPDAILHKPGGLTLEEFEIMKTHTTIGAMILSGAKSELMDVAEQIALNHHERWDGGGYPRGLRGEEIPLSARVVAVVDVHDALAHDRPYRPAWPEETILELLHREAGAHFDPVVVAAFERVLDSDRRLS